MKINVNAQPTNELIALLYARGVTIAEIFGKYYEYEAQAEAQDDKLFGSDEEGQHGRQLTVDDALLAMEPNLTSSTSERKPF